MSVPAVSRRRGRRRLPAPCACLIVLDGWGLAEPGPGNAVSLARTPVFDELWDVLPAHDADGVRARGGPAGRADGQQRGRAPEPRRGRGRAPGPGAHRRRGRGRLAGAERGAARGVRGRRARAPARAGVRRRRALLARAPARADRARARAGGARIWSCTRSPTAATRCRTRARATCASSTRTPGARVGSVVGRYWAMDRDRRWERTQRAYDLLVHGEAPLPRRQRRAGRPGRLPQGRDGRVHRADARRRGGARSAPATA